jgi:homopolymeric O-antigen transport system permease protein
MTVYADLLRYRELFGNLFRRDFQARYKGSALGVLWSLVNPLLLMGIYLVVFSVLFRFDIPHYPLFLLSGLTVWLFFAGSLSLAGRSMIDSANLIKKVRFPRQLVPLSIVATQLVTFALMLVALIVVNLIALPETRGTFWLTVPLAALVVAFVSGLALAIASANVVFRDIEHIVGALLLPLFFLTPVFYTLDLVPGASDHEAVVQLLHWGNPLTPAIEAVRAPLFWGEWPGAGDVVYLAVESVLALALGAWVFSRVDDRLAVEL